MIQDIEAEDKLVGYLGIRQFVYVIIAASSAFVIFRMFIAPELGPARYFVILMFFLPMVVFGILSAPLGRDQPTEVWILSRLRYYLKPRVRVWNQSGLKELVTITAPKKIEKHYTDGLSQNEVRSRLQALATTLDSRGWAVKNANVTLNTQPIAAVQQTSDRLVDSTSLPQATEIVDVRAEDDILDPLHNNTARHFDRLMKESGEKVRAKAAKKPDFYFMHQNSTAEAAKKKPATEKIREQLISSDEVIDEAVFGESKVVEPGVDDASMHSASRDDDEASRQLLEQVRQQREHENDVVSHSHERRIPTMAERREQEAREKAQAELTAAQQAAMMELAHNDQYRVSTAGQQANRIMTQAPVRAAETKPEEPTEIVIQLH